MLQTDDTKFLTIFVIVEAIGVVIEVFVVEVVADEDVVELVVVVLMQLGNLFRTSHAAAAKFGTSV